MEELIPVEVDKLPVEAEQDTMPAPAEGKRLYIRKIPKMLTSMHFWDKSCNA